MNSATATIDAAATAATQPPPPLVPAAAAAANTPTPTEDDQHEEGSSIATFCAYQPTALPNSVIRVYNSNGTTNSTVATIGSPTNSNKENSLIINTSKNGSRPDTALEIIMEDEQDSIPPNPKIVDEPPLTLTVPSHTSSACESNLLASVPAAPVHLAATAECLWSLLTTTPVPPLSPLQMEGVLLAIQRHCRLILTTSSSGQQQEYYRAGFFLGDGAGIGKGRQIGAILRDSLGRSPGAVNNGHTKRHVWLSVSRELIQDARRDLRDVGVTNCDVYDGTQLLDDRNAGLGQKKKGVLFLTYPLLVSGKRLEQIVAWCAGTQLYQSSTSESALAKVAHLEQTFSGCIIFDEAHKAKNLSNDTKTAQLVLQLQRRLPKARVVYCSATGVSDVAHLAYAERLGLWDTTRNHSGNHTNNSTHNFANFGEFQKSLEQRGLGSLELLALELKQQGSFLARTLSWEGAEFQTTEVQLTKAQIHVYDQSVAWWNHCKACLEEAQKVTDPGQQGGLVWRNFWSCHQRYFKELAICAKIDDLAKDCLEQIANGYCVVIGLQSTGEAGLQSLLGTKTDSEEQFPVLFSTIQAVLTNFVKNHFPVTPAPVEPPTWPTDPPGPDASEVVRQYYQQVQAEIERIAALPPPEPVAALLEMRQTLLDGIQKLDLPPNPLDDLIDRLGGVDQVAEMTGRSGRMVRACSSRDPSQKFDYFTYVKRVTASSNNCAAASQDDSDRINLVERRKFMDGSKSVAIISDAASTGISLHAARGSGGSHKRRVHYTIELPWSADKAVQQLGRSHRSGQESAPIYKLVVTSLGGERRFAAAVSKRMASLGALTKGDRRAATGSDMLSDFDLDSKYGKRALKRFYNALENNERLQADPNGYLYFNAATAFPSRNTKDILEAFLEQLVKDKDPIVATLPNTETMKQSVLLAMATSELDLIGMDKENRKKADVRVFLNRLAGLAVSKQFFVFTLFMATLADVIKDAKATGEFEGTAEDLKATSIVVADEIDLAVDPTSGAPTKLTTLTLDRGVSFVTACDMAVEEARKVKSISGDNIRTDTSDNNAMAVEAEGEVERSENGKKDEGCDDDNDDDDEWMSKASKKDNIAASGFYVSRNKIAGRHLVLFAKPKFDRASFQTSEEAAAFDPLGWMIITRPNTGTNLTDMNSKDLGRKYQLLCSCKKLKQQLDRDKESSPTSLLEKASKEATRLWKDAYTESYFSNHHNGLAPRIQTVALVTGPVLHVMPALEKAVSLRSEKERALKIQRAQTESRRFVGVRFPADNDAIEKLQTEIAKVLEARSDAGNAFIDEDLAPVCMKSLDWATTERKTMKSFFKAAAPKSAACAGSSRNKKRSASSSPTKSKDTTGSQKKTKTKSIASFFGVPTKS